MGRKKKFTLEVCKEIRKDFLEGMDIYLLGKKYEASKTTIENAILKARAHELGMSWENMLLWKKNAFAYNRDTGMPILFSEDKEEQMLSMNDLVKGLSIAKSNISRIIKKLDITPHKKRGNMHQWEYYFDTKQITAILRYREGLPHKLILTESGYKIRD